MVSPADLLKLNFISFGNDHFKVTVFVYVCVSDASDGQQTFQH